MSAPVSIVTVTYNSFRCLERLAAGLEPIVKSGAAEWIIVDSGSKRPATHGLLDDLLLSHEATVIRLPDNVLFTRGCNVGIKAADGEFILLLNPDCAPINETWLDSMLAVARRPGVGVTGSLLVNERDVVVHAGGVNRGDHLAYGVPLSDLPMELQRARPHPEWITGACLMVSRQALDAVGGGLDEAHPHYHSDRVLCEAVRAAGFKVWMSDARLIHTGGGSAL